MLGSPIAHSLSPVLHLAAYRELGLRDWSYDALECDADGLPALLNSLGPQWAGLSLTMPLKRAVLPLLDDAEQLVSEVGAANTVLLSEGRRHGYNTDVPGMVTAIAEAGADAGGRVLIVGGGATACSALAALQSTSPADITVAVRDTARAGQIREVAGRLGLTIKLAVLGEDLKKFEGERGRPHWHLLISTVPSGGAEYLAQQLGEGAIAADAVFDVIYDPWPTKLATAATESGATVISGFELLLHQAARQVELMTGFAPPVQAMRAAGLAELDRRHEGA